MALVSPPTPSEFADKMKEIKGRFFTDMYEDFHECHVDMDTYILEVLESLGYKDGVAVFRSTPKWYS